MVNKKLEVNFYYKNITFRAVKDSQSHGFSTSLGVASLSLLVCPIEGSEPPEPDPPEPNILHCTVPVS
jgi:hypothetical protein